MPFLASGSHDRRASRYIRSFPQITHGERGKTAICVAGTSASSWEDTNSAKVVCMLARSWSMVDSPPCHAFCKRSAACRAFSIAAAMQTQILSTSMTGGLQHVKYDSDRDLTACSDLSDSGKGAHRRNYKTAPKPSPMSSPIPGKGRQAVGGAANLVSEQTCSVHNGDAKAAIRQSREHRHQKGRRQHLIHHRPSQEQCLWQYCNNTSAARQV